MFRSRNFLIILIALLVAATVIVTRVYEENLKSQQTVRTVVKPGYKVFNKETNGFSFSYPLSWNFESKTESPYFTNGFFKDDKGNPKLYFESPFSGQGFSFYFENNLPYFSEGGNIFSIRSVSNTKYFTNDTSTPIFFSIYKKCVEMSTTSTCPLDSKGGIAVAYWERGKTRPVLNEKSPSAYTGVLMASLPQDKSSELGLLNQFDNLLKSLKFNEAGVKPDSNRRWKTYFNSDLHYYIHYPEQFTVLDQIDLSFAYMSTGTAINFPIGYEKGSNLSEARILIGEVLPEFSKDCLSFRFGESNTEAEKIILNNQEYYKSIGVGAAAGNRYDTITYATIENQKCVHITLYLHSTNVMNYDEKNRPREFDFQKSVNIFNAILSTFSFK